MLCPDPQTELDCPVLQKKKKIKLTMEMEKNLVNIRHIQQVQIGILAEKLGIS